MHHDQTTMKQQMRIYYDEEGDFLEISAGKASKCHAEEVEPGIFIRKDEETNEIKSIGILGFKKRSKDVQNIRLKLPVKLSITAS